MKENYMELISQAVSYLKENGIGNPETGVILGSGLNNFDEYLAELEAREDVPNPVVISYSDIPGFCTTRVSGHAGKLIYAEDNGCKVVILAGRYHYYEGHDISDVVFPTRVLIKLGIKRLIITNASGAINEAYGAPSLMLISDHINLTGNNPLIGPNIDEFGPRFPDMTDAYDRRLREQIHEGARELGITLNEGVYVGLAGPNFETPAEIRFLRIIGGDCVGMSSVPEALVANHAGLEIVGISLLSNMAAGITGNALTAEEVNEAGEHITGDFHKILNLAIKAK